MSESSKGGQYNIAGIVGSMALVAAGGVGLASNLTKEKKPNPPAAPDGGGAKPATSAPAKPAPKASASASGKAASAPKTPPKCASGMTGVPAGEFEMGFVGEGAAPFEGPVHKVQVSAFCIDTTEVTTADYAACVKDGKCKASQGTVKWQGVSPKQKSVFGGICSSGKAKKNAKLPINCVTWEQADAYCKQRGARLPSSAEWEFAARGTDGRIYPWGKADPAEGLLNACDGDCGTWAKSKKLPLKPYTEAKDGSAFAAPVGGFTAGKSAFGVLNLGGNVMEWVGDWYGDYTKDAAKDPQGPKEGSERIARGASFTTGSAARMRASFRSKFPPSTSSHAIGFRCATGPAKLGKPRTPPARSAHRRNLRAPNENPRQAMSRRRGFLLGAKRRGCTPSAMSTT